jgi:hypothetical protein
MDKDHSFLSCFQDRRDSRYPSTITGISFNRGVVTAITLSRVYRQGALNTWTFPTRDGFTRSRSFVSRAACGHLPVTMTKPGRSINTGRNVRSCSEKNNNIMARDESLPRLSRSFIVEFSLPQLAIKPCLGNRGGAGRGNRESRQAAR